MIYLNNNSGPCKINVVHIFSDNCATQYKCKDAFWYLCLLEAKYTCKLIYHYTEAGHGKGPSDGLGAGIKKKLERLILGGNVINNAYQAYLALRQHKNYKIKQEVIYIPKKMVKRSSPKKNHSLKTIKGTQSFHMIRQL